MTRNQNQDGNDNASSSSSSSRKRLKSFDKGDVGSCSDLNHDVLFLVMMQLGFIDFFAFSGVCKSWRSLAHANMNRFMASKPPMSIRFNRYAADNKEIWHLNDFEGREFKIIVPHSAGKILVRCTCGYLIFMGKETHDFWLVNPITRHELYFPDHLLCVVIGDHEVIIKAILVFSPSISGWVFVMLYRKVSSPYSKGKGKISFCMEGKRGWNQVSSTLHILDFHAFKGKIYTLHTDFSVSELRLNLNGKPKWMLFKSKNFTKPDLSHPELVSSGENLYVMDRLSPHKVLELDFGEMKWVYPENTIEQYAFFISGWMKSSAAIKPELSWAGPPTQYKTYNHLLDTDKSRKHSINYNSMWYFPHDCLNVNLLDE
ncbi:unnamed protein product [Lactuca virosa]|uniref:F-box domain-containing protein n=1 Tax=Lactuca virosa TaxID=75947 RepID=A0AAU9PFQ9_9ASTR|nr:unnamed protein product [Lactuca virosa]